MRMVSTPQIITTQIIGQSPASAEPGAGNASPGAIDGTPCDAPEDAGPTPTPPRVALDPTRYGDWEKNGRCIDF